MGGKRKLNTEYCTKIIYLILWTLSEYLSTNKLFKNLIGIWK